MSSSGKKCVSGPPSNPTNPFSTENTPATSPAATTFTSSARGGSGGDGFNGNRTTGQLNGNSETGNIDFGAGGGRHGNIHPMTPQAEMMFRQTMPWLFPGFVPPFVDIPPTGTSSRGRRQARENNHTNDSNNSGSEEGQFREEELD